MSFHERACRPVVSRLLASVNFRGEYDIQLPLYKWNPQGTYRKKLTRDQENRFHLAKVPLIERQL